MVCTYKPLPAMPERIDFLRIPINRLNLDSFYDNFYDTKLEGLADEKIEKYGFKDFLLETSIKSLIIAGGVGILYGACRLLEYYGIIEKIR